MEGRFILAKCIETDDSTFKAQCPTWTTCLKILRSWLSPGRLSNEFFSSPHCHLFHFQTAFANLLPDLGGGNDLQSRMMVLNNLIHSRCEHPFILRCQEGNVHFQTPMILWETCGKELVHSFQSFSGVPVKARATI